MLEIFSVNLVTFAFFKHTVCHDSLENVAGVDAVEVFAQMLLRKKWRVLNVVKPYFMRRYCSRVMSVASVVCPFPVHFIVYCLSVE